ncbi:MAG: hypothetical protein R3F46_07630 [bacterium]
MRLIVTILWSIAALCWLPWAMMLVRLILDLALGTPPLESGYLPLVLQGLWPRWQILGPWYVHSWFPVCAFLGSVLVTAGWRIYWVNEYYRLTRPLPRVILSILVPPYAVFLMYDDALRRHNELETDLAHESEDARLRLDTRS